MIDVNKMNLTKQIIELEEIDSTNDYLKRDYQKLSNYTVVKTKYQTNGHGQFDRIWESSSNKNLLFSILIKDKLPFNKDEINKILVSAIFTALEKVNINNAYYKEPNDIYIDDKKLAGILIETKYNDKKLIYLIIGIGININQDNFNNDNAISLKQLLKNDLDINNVFMNLIIEIQSNIYLKNKLNLGEKLEC